MKAAGAAVVRGETYSVAAPNSTGAGVFSGGNVSSRSTATTSAVQDALLAAPRRSFALSAFPAAGEGLASILRPPGGYMRRIVGVAAGIIGAAAIVAIGVSCGSDSTGPTPKRYVANLSPANPQLSSRNLALYPFQILPYYVLLR